MNYEEIRELLNIFLNESGIRQYCVERCGAKCCTGCYDHNELSCKYYEGEEGRLTCLASLCDKLCDMLNDLGIQYSFVKITVFRTVRYHWRPRDIFHHPLPDEVKKVFEIENIYVDELRDVLSDGNAYKIRQHLNREMKNDYLSAGKI